MKRLHDLEPQALAALGILGFPNAASACGSLFIRPGWGLWDKLLAKN